MNSMTIVRWFACVVGIGPAGLLAAVAADVAPATSPCPCLGHWDLTMTDGTAGWLAVGPRSDDELAASVLWSWGSVNPVSVVGHAGENLTLRQEWEETRHDAAGNDTGKDTVIARFDVEHLADDTLRIVRTITHGDAANPQKAEARGRRSAPLPPRPDLARVEFGPAIDLLAADDRAGWRLVERDAINGWSVAGGVLTNRPEPAAPGQPGRHYGNLRTEREFEDFRLTLDVSVPAGSNSGIYLRGIYEVQVLDSYGQALDAHNLGAIYSRLTPRVAAEKPAGEWQTLEITLVDRHVTVVLNGVTIIANEPLLGCTGGALWADESRPGPILLQGDHGAVAFRRLRLQPVVARH